jgi:hypothetical protein
LARSTAARSSSAEAGVCSTRRRCVTLLMRPRFYVPVAFGRAQAILPTQCAAACVSTRSGSTRTQTGARTNIFSRVAKRIAIAARVGGPDLVTNRVLVESLAEASALSFA